MTNSAAWTCANPSQQFLSKRIVKSVCGRFAQTHRRRLLCRRLTILVWFLCRYLAALLMHKKTLSVFLDMRDSSAWLQPVWTIQCRAQWLCNPPWLTGKETLATGTTTQFSWVQEVNPPQLGLGGEGGGHTLHMNNFLNEHYLNWWLVS